MLALRKGLQCQVYTVICSQVWARLFRDNLAFSVFLNIRFSHDLYLLPSSNYRSQFNNKTWPIWEVFFLCRLCILLKCTFDYSVFFATWCVNNWRKLLGLKVSTCRQKVSNLGTVISLKALRHEWILRTIIGCTKKISFIKMALIIFFTFIYVWRVRIQRIL